MADQETTALYTLSTLAQTCAALAAFVGAVGLFRLQALREGRREAERELRTLAVEAGAVSPDWVMILSTNRIIRDVQKKLGGEQTGDPRIDALQQGLQDFQAFSPRYRRSRWALFFFEGWNVLVIGAALVGFNYVQRLAAWRGASRLLWVVSVITVVVTFACVVVWTGEAGQFSETWRNMRNRLPKWMRW